MAKLIQILRTMVALSAFFAMVYLNDIWMYLAPTRRIHRWGITTFRLFHPVWPGGDSGSHRV